MCVCVCVAGGGGGVIQDAIKLRGRGGASHETLQDMAGGGGHNKRH